MSHKTPKTKLIMPNDDEDKIITQQAVDDDTLLSDADLTEFKPFEKSNIPNALKDTARKVGRPPLDNPKVPVSIRLDSEVLDYFKSTGKGWQTNINDVLKEYVRNH